ncbi:GB1/RHD3-type G domain-containing protein [Pycnococcus provasolii]
MAASHGWLRWLILVAILHCLWPQHCALVSATRVGEPIRLVAPTDDHTRLQADSRGLDVLRRSPDGVPVSLVSVIGPYRSGKSFLLNRLLGVPCDEGFGVGHRRETQTKGAWIWSEAVTADADADADASAEPATRVFYIDTEGFESAGRSGNYDDRLFAFAAAVSSVLVYNLPESVREGDIMKLSFAMDLAKEFVAPNKTSATKLQSKGFPPGTLYWLIQRDFLEGSTVQQAVDTALAKHANPDNNRDLAQLNDVRLSLRSLGWEHIGRGLRQPHVDRTRLCELTDDQLDSTYVTQMHDLRHDIRSRAASQPRRLAILRDSAMDGKALATLIERVVEALSDTELPSWSRNLVEAFNHELVDVCSDAFRTEVRGAGGFPLETDVLEARISAANATAVETCYLSRRFGTSGVSARLLSRVNEHADACREHNALMSTSGCEAAALQCEQAMDSLSSVGVLLSKARFDAGIASCMSSTFDVKCKGPRRSYHQGRLEERRRGTREHLLVAYNEQLHARALGALVSMAIFTRCAWRSWLLESAAWLSALLLWAYPHATTFLGSTIGAPSLYETRFWFFVSVAWECVAIHPFVTITLLALLLLGSFRATVYRFVHALGCCGGRVGRLAYACLRFGSKPKSTRASV